MSTRKGIKSISSRLLKSDQLFQSSHHLMTTGDWNGAISFLYYASFHAVACLLEQVNMNVESHTSTRRLFDSKFVKSSVVQAKYGQLYSHL